MISRLLALLRAEKRLKDVEKGLGSLQEAFDALARAHRALDSDNDDLWARYERFEGRTSKRRALEAKAEAQEQPAPTTRLGRIQAQIFEARKGGTNGVRP